MWQSDFVLDDEIKESLKSLTESIHLNGKELPNPIPYEVSPRLNRPLTLQEQIRRCLRVELSKKAQESEMETFDEANDFEVDETGDAPLSGYEVMTNEYPVPTPAAGEPAAADEGGEPVAPAEPVEGS